VILYAVVSDEIERVIEFFPTRDEAETLLARVLADEPDWREILHVEPIVLRARRAELSSSGSRRPSGLMELDPIMGPG
jgi:hypothetical protein